jgi:hypothetical protein
MNNYILLFNIGNRDVKLDQKELEKGHINEKGEEIFNNFESYKDKVSLEIVEPFLNEFSSETKKIYLFVTDQYDANFKANDTIFFGKIIQRMIQEKYSIECEIRSYPFNPTDYEKAFEFFGEFFIELDKNYNNDMFIISNSGGVPAMKFAMLVLATNLLNQINIYSVNEKSHDLKLIPHKKTLKKEFVKQSGLALLKTYDYLGINSLLIENNFNSNLSFLLRYATERYSFNFEQANENLIQYLKTIDELEKKKLNPFIIAIKDNDSLLRELIFNMEIKLKNKEYTDFFGRLYRFVEAFAQRSFDRAAKTNINWENKDERDIQFSAFLDNHLELKKHIQKYLKLTTVNDNITPNYLPLYHGITFFKMSKATLVDVTSLNKLYQNVDKFRHKSIIAHGFKGISEDDINAELKNKKIEDIIGNIKSICASDGMEIPENPFNSLNILLEHKLNEL